MQDSFKSKRIELELSISEIAKTIKVKSSYLEAIEENDFASLPEPVYTKGYIREYARFLQVSADEKLAKYEAFLNKDKIVDTLAKDTTSQKEQQPPPPKPATQVKDNKPTQNTKKAIPSSVSFKNIFTLLFVIVIAFAVGAFAYITVFKAFDYEVKNTMPPLPPPPITDNATTHTDNATPSDNSTDNATLSAITTTTSANTVTESKQEGKKKKTHILQIQATHKTWLFVKPDNSTGYEKTLQPGDNLTVEAYKNIYLKLGNAGGVTLKFNGKQIPKLGELNSVKSIVLPNALNKTEEESN